MKPLITVGCTTDHGGMIESGDSSFLVEGKSVHLDGMSHFCPKCKTQSTAIASHQGFITVKGKSIVAEGDSATCGAKYLRLSDLAVISNDRNQYIFNNSAVNSTNTMLAQDNLLSSAGNEIAKAKILPNVHLPIMGLLASLQRLDGKPIQESDDIKINGTELREVWIAKNGIAYFVPLKNIPQIQSIEINGESLKLDNNLRQFKTNKECVDSLSEQFKVLNEAISEHKNDFGEKNVSWIMTQGLRRYELVLSYIEQLKWDTESQQYLIEHIENNNFKVIIF